MFITKEDFASVIHDEILSSLTREDDTIIDLCINDAIEYVRSKLSSRYDCDDIFGRAEKDRSRLVMRCALYIALYYIFSGHNPYKMSDLIKDNYKSAQSWLDDVHDCKANITDAKLLDDTTAEKNSPWQLSSNELLNDRF